MFLLTVTVFANEEMEFENIKVSRHDKVLLLRIDFPPRNEVSKRTLVEIDAGLDIAENDSAIGAVVITGTGPIFSAGAGGESMKKAGKDEKAQSVIALEVYRRIEGFPKPVVSAVNGISTNGGNELALSTDIRIAAKSAVFGQQELLVGVIPGFGGMQRLQRHVGLSKAMEMILTGKTINAKEAYQFGLVAKVVPDNDVLAETISYANLLAENLDPNAFAIFKKRMSESYDEEFTESLINDQIAFDEVASSEEAAAAIARFIKKLQAKQK